jgi:uncharacterized protein YhbP (UPF0306 family)
MGKAEEVAHKIITSNRYMTMATGGSNDLSEPGVWANAVAYAYDDAANLYWYSAVDAVHSINIYQNPQVAIAIFNSTESSDVVDGLQLACAASEVDPEHLDEVMNLYFTQSFSSEQDRKAWQRPRTDFEGDAIQRFFVARISRAYKIDYDVARVDRRRVVDVDQLRGLLGMASGHS